VEKFYCGENIAGCCVRAMDLRSAVESSVLTQQHQNFPVSSTSLVMSVLMLMLMLMMLMMMIEPTDAHVVPFLSLHDILHTGLD